MNASPLDELLIPKPDPIAAGWRLRELAETEAIDGPGLLVALSDRAQDLPSTDLAVLGGLLRVLHTRLLRDNHRATPESGGKIDPWQHVHRLLESLPEGTPNRYLLLHLLAMSRNEESIALLLDHLGDDPPQDWIEAAQTLSPLMQYSDWPVDAFFPRALSLLEYPTLAAPILDIANYLVRTERTTKHPAQSRLAMLSELLGGVTQRLERFEHDPRSFGDDVPTVQQRLGEAVSLAVSLCDSLGLIGQEHVIGRLRHTLELKHRRVQCEAAGAMARLGDDEGRKRLVELAQEPSARLRAIHYADELGIGEQIDESFRTDEATAEAEMALWLSQPQQMGVPPTNVEIVESRRLLWPSFTNPINVFLVRFEYRFGEQIYSNVGIAGPAVFALSCDVADLPSDDIYAIYAGWHAEHADIFAIPASQLNSAQQRMVEPLQHHLDRLGLDALQAELLGFFLDEHAAVFRGFRGDLQVRVVTDGLETIEQPISGRLRPMSANDVFNLYKGRKMLRTFNG